MKTFRLIAASFVFAALFAVSAYAQAAAAPTGKVGLINTFAFEDEKAGITKYRNAISSVEVIFKPDNDKLRASAARYEALRKELEGFQKSRQDNKPVPISDAALQGKVDELSKLERDIKFQQEDAKARYERQYQTTVGPILGDIMKAMQDFAKQKGYAVILDGAKLQESGLLMAFDEKYNVTTEFIQFYNNRPAGTASTATPK
ncbi:MAG TPA: OmpH family outer membrane protein [Pyrinomonadaceae bacterium]|jgi:Skp family chaperone for outer membrane proteins